MNANIVTLPAVIHAQCDCAKQLAERFLNDAMGILEKRFKDDLQMLHMKPEHYAAQHPEIAAALVQAQAMAFQTLAIGEALRDIREMLNDHGGELASAAESVDTTLSGIETSLDNITEAVRALDRK